MNGRTFITGFGSAAIWPVVARGQQSSIPVIGFLAGKLLNAEWRELMPSRGW